MSDDLLLIDMSEQAYTVYYKITADKLKLNQDKISPDTHQTIAWSDFMASRDQASKYILKHILHNDYEGVDIVAGLCALIDRLGGAPVGLTWSGGIAFTYGDYQHAKRTHAAWSADPSSHVRRERAADPVHPLNHLGPLLSGR